jgi:small GTP-binding protein
MRKFDGDSVRVRVVLIGDSSVGKTSILSQLIDQRYYPDQSATVAASYHIFPSYHESHNVEMQIWDTAGEERFRALGPIYYRNTAAAIAVFDVTNRASFDNLPGWIQGFREVAGDHTVIVIVANKVDLVLKRDVTKDEAEKFAQNYFRLYETSALTGDNVQAVFMDLAKELSKDTPEIVAAPPLPSPTDGCAC